MLALVLITLLGSRLLTKVTGLRVLGASLSASVIFFLVSNLGPWLALEIYPNTLAGLVTAYIAAIPFFGSTMLGDLVFCGVLFGGFAMVSNYWHSHSTSA